MVAKTVTMMTVVVVLWYSNNRIQYNLEEVKRRSIPFEAQDSAIPIGSQAPSFQLPDIEGGIYSSDMNYSKFKLLIFLSLRRDCPSCLEEAPLWRELENKFERDLTLIGIMDSEESEQTIADFKNKYQLKFQMFPDKENHVRNKYGVIYTPLRFLIDESNKIIDIDRPSPSKTKQRHFKELIYSLFPGSQKLTTH